MANMLVSIFPKVIEQIESKGMVVLLMRQGILLLQSGCCDPISDIN